jgi:hypothetical protein
MGSNPAVAFPIEAYSAAAARPPVNSLLFIVLAFLTHPIADRKESAVWRLEGLLIEQLLRKRRYLMDEIAPRDFKQ